MATKDLSDAQYEGHSNYVKTVIGIIISLTTSSNTNIGTYDYCLKQCCLNQMKLNTSTVSFAPDAVANAIAELL